MCFWFAFIVYYGNVKLSYSYSVVCKTKQSIFVNEFRLAPSVSSSSRITVRNTHRWEGF